MPASTVLSTLFDDGQRIVVSAGRKNENGQKPWVNKLFTELAPAEKWLQARAKSHHNVYVKHASFDGEIGPRGMPRCDLRHALGSRSFFVDLDCGPGQPYASPKEAVSSLNTAFGKLKALFIPPPNLLQLSGHGVQAVWASTEVHNTGEWKVLNGVLYSLLQEHGVLLDVAVMALERGVRLCGAQYLNYKDTPVPTKVMFVRNRIPAELLRRVLLPHRMRVVSTIKEGLKEYLVPSGFEFHIADVVDHCEVLKDARITRGATHGFAVWTDIVALCARDADDDTGTRWAHAFSDGHSGYDPDLVNKKLNSYRAGASEAYITCKRFETTFPTACGACAYRGKVNSCAGIPRAIRELPEQDIRRESGEAVAEALPGGEYANKPLGLTYLHREGPILIWRGRFVSAVSLVEDAVSRETMLGFTVTHSEASRREVLLSMHQMSNSKTLQTALSSFTLPLINPEATGVHRAVTAWITELQRKDQTRQTYSRLGWAGNDFVLGDRVYTPNGPVPFTNLNPEMADFIPAGSLTICQAVEARSIETRPEMHALLATSYAAVLIELCGGLIGFVFNFYSERSGFGKTYTAKRATSVWGRPSALTLGGNDTQNAIINKLGRLHSLLAVFDDPDLIDPVKQYRSLIYNAGRGVEKQRLTADAKPQAHTTWKTFLVFLTNQRLSGVVDGEQLRGDATAARFLDFQVHPLPSGAHENTAEYMQLGSSLDSNYGHLGAIYIDYVVRHQDALRALLVDVTGKLMPRTALQADDVSGRLQAAAGACLIVAAHICKKINLTPIDPRLVVAAVNKALDMSAAARRVGQKRITPQGVLKTFCHDRVASRVLTTFAGGKTFLVNDHPRVDLPVAYEVDRTTGAKTAWVSVAELRTYMAKQGVSVLPTLEALSYLMHVKKKSLAEGTVYATPRQSVLKLPLADPSWSDLDV
jgi:hypothetical protein